MLWRRLRVSSVKGMVQELRRDEIGCVVKAAFLARGQEGVTLADSLETLDAGLVGGEGQGDAARVHHLLVKRARNR